jgi:hypothetical protein
VSMELVLEVLVLVIGLWPSIPIFFFINIDASISWNLSIV